MTIRGTVNCARYVRSITAVRELLQSVSEKLDRLPPVRPADSLWEVSVEALRYDHIYDLEHAASQLDTVLATLDMIPKTKGQADD